ncbi:efflux RND transporter periplasmic adaptor subunit [Armatimonas sp.]|uniref:efflux RND transporter periplasmic adaptor subunit n=1 Tax=Armatimonas sp. TaxID=1872638 RepID=UPI00286BED43|nr:efflux RND transporter periplasmic adaptor subunit [Armatimonas sp.]
MKLRSIIPYTVLVAALAGGIVWRLQDKRAVAGELVKSQAARKNSAPSVVLAVAGPQKLVQTLEIMGSLESPSTVKLAARSAGRVTFLAVREGSTVAAGQTLVRIDPVDLKAAVTQQEASVPEAKARLAQAQATVDTGRVSVLTGIEQRSAAVESAQATLSRAQQSRDALLAAAKAAVADADARVQSARVVVENAKNDHASALANQSNLKAKLTRAESLLEKGFVAAQAVEDARTVLDVQGNVVATAHGRIATAEAALESQKALLAAAKEQVTVTEKGAIGEIGTAKAAKKQAESALVLAKSNRSQSVAMRENIAALRQSVAAAESQLTQARARLAETELRSTISGIVTAKPVDEGSSVTAGQTILTIQQLDSLYLTASVPVEQSSAVGIGTKAEVVLDALPGKPFLATVAEVNPAADPQSRQYTIRCKLENASGKLRPGMFAHLTLELRTINAAVVVPSDAVKTTPKGSTVTVVDAENTASVRQVTLGTKVGGAVEVLSGVAAGERVVTLSYSPVKDAQKVKTAEGAAKGPKVGRSPSDASSEVKR